MIAIDGKNHHPVELYDQVQEIRDLLEGAYEAFEVEEHSPAWDPLRCAIRHFFVKSAFLPYVPASSDDPDAGPVKVVFREELGLYHFLTSIVYRFQNKDHSPIIPETKETWLGGLFVALDYIRTYENRSIQIILLNMKAHAQRLLDETARRERLKDYIVPSEEDLETVNFWTILSTACGGTCIHDDNTRRFTELWETMMVHNYHAVRLNPDGKTRSENLIHSDMPVDQILEVITCMERFTKTYPEIAARINQYRAVALHKEPMESLETVRQLRIKYEQLQVDHDRLKAEVDRKEDHHPKLREQMDPDPHLDDDEEMKALIRVSQETVQEDIARSRGLSIGTGQDKKV